MEAQKGSLEDGGNTWAQERCALELSGKKSLPLNSIAHLTQKKVKEIKLFSVIPQKKFYFFVIISMNETILSI